MVVAIKKLNPESTQGFQEWKRLHTEIQSSLHNVKEDNPPSLPHLTTLPEGSDHTHASIPNWCNTKMTQIEFLQSPNLNI
ncbi:hypothetical protein LR48_Vigan02g007700 [Vigna angularis]|uniref:Uncharacterized protein n=1 Tax=Phaseolus angularis TaxID=3914 RepID=A0A0L9TU42_PHAAN|nr:hypothetical protein LR48_Vigan02g007700 [Vigna angularis]